jgi:transposase
VAGVLDVSRQSVSEWVRAHRLGGDAALAAGKRGRRPGEKTALAPGQQAQIAKAIRDKNPDQLRLPGFLWTRALVCELIDRRFGIRVAEKTVGRYLRAWGFSPQKPARRALEQNPELVARWLDERYPEIEARAHHEKALILWADEMGLRSDHTAGRSWSPVGRTPVVEGTGQRFGANVISAISNKGRLQFRVFRQRFTTPVFIDFLARLVRQAGGQKIILILDGHPVHRAKKVRAWVHAHAEQIELQFLPGYSPELNPTELLNQDVKTNALGRRRPTSQDELIGDTRSYLRSTQRRPQRVTRYFDGEPSPTPGPHDSYLPTRRSKPSSSRSS